MAHRLYITKRTGSDAVSEHFLALDATSKHSKPQELHVIRYLRDLCARQDFSAPLELEVATELTLTHPNILRLFTCGVWENACFLAYEKIESVSLAAAIRAQGKKTGFELGFVASVAIQLLQALEYVHSGSSDPSAKRKKAFHCGFSPELLELSFDGVVKTRGFAINAVQNTKRPSQLDLALNRFPYFSLPMMESQALTPGSDLFSLGALLWELITAQPLFQRPTPEETLKTIKGKEIPSVTSLSPLVPAELDSVISRLLLRDPAFQFSSAAEARAALEKALFTANIQASYNEVARVARAVPKSASTKDSAGEKSNKVLAEVMGTTALQKALAGHPEEPAQPHADLAAPKPAPKEAATPTPWEKHTKFTEVDPDAPELQLPEKPFFTPKLLLALGAILLTTIGLGAAWILFPDDNPATLALSSVVQKIAGKPGSVVGGNASISAAFAYRNPEDPSRRVQIQGLRQDDTEHYIKECGESGERCRCEFFLAPDDPAPAATSRAALSRKYNYLYCELPEGVNSRFVRISGLEDKPRQSKVLLIASALSWGNILGPALAKQKIRWIYRYECERTFFEGEGVDASGGAITCSPMQKLGTLQATFNFYTYYSDEDSNQPGSDVDFKHPVCGITHFKKIRCQSTNLNAQFGLYKTENFPFLNPVTLYRAPEGDDLLSVVGYAATPDKLGNCPVGMTGIRQWTASPPTIDEHFKDGSGLPTSFVSPNGELKNRVFESREPRPFVVARRKNRTPCDGKGDCTLAALEDVSEALSVPYVSDATICVLNPSLLEASLKPEDVAAKALGHTKEAAPEATVEVKSTIADFEARVNSVKVKVSGNSFKVPLHKPLEIELSKVGFKPVRLTVPALEKTDTIQVEAAFSKVKIGTVDFASFPPAEATFWLGMEKIFSGPTPVKETLPAGKYRVTVKALKSGAEGERWITIEDGKNTVVDYLIPEPQRKQP